MKFTLTIEGESLSELNELLDRRAPVPVRGSTAAEAAQPEPTPEVETETPKKSRSRKGADAAASPPSTATPTASGAESSTKQPDTQPGISEASEGPVNVTLDDIRTKASQLMDSGKATGADIQNLLVTKFDGARAFGALKPKQYADVLGELSNLG